MNTAHKLNQFDIGTTKPHTTDLTLVEADCLNDHESFFAPMSSDFVDLLIAEYEQEKKTIFDVSNVLKTYSAASVLGYFIEGNLWDERNVLPSKLDNLFNTDGAIAKLDAAYWSRAFKLTDVYDYMPQKRRDEWNNQIRYPQGRTATSSSPAIEALPHFDDSTVRATLDELLNSRSQFFAERVDGIFRGLSKSHVTNQPEGFSKRMIVSSAIENGSVDYSKAGLINDLRTVIAKFMGRDEPCWDDTSKVFEVIRQQNGVWQSVDGGSLRVRIYNGIGTVHIEVHPDMAWRLNAILASIYPAAIPAKFRSKPPKTKKLKEFTLFDKPLPFAVTNAIANMRQGFEFIQEGRYSQRRYIPNSLLGVHSQSFDKAIRKSIAETIQAIGGVFDGKNWLFSYDPAAAINEIVCNGSIPDHKSHQFYPTKASLAQRVVESVLDGTNPYTRWLEPSAGCGDLADLIPSKQFVHCVEISKLHCQILRSKGYSNVYDQDFLTFASDACSKGINFDRIVMNPPFSESRYLTHLQAASSLLQVGGTLAAILPASVKGKILVEGFHHEYSEVLDNQFAGTSVSVVILHLSHEAYGK